MLGLKSLELKLIFITCLIVNKYCIRNYIFIISKHEKTLDFCIFSPFLFINRTIYLIARIILDISAGSNLNICKCIPNLRCSHLKDKIYCPSSRLSGTSTKSLIAHLCGLGPPLSGDFSQRFILAHYEPGGVVPIVAVLMGCVVFHFLT